MHWKELFAKTGETRKECKECEKVYLRNIDRQCEKGDLWNHVKSSKNLNFENLLKHGRMLKYCVCEKCSKQRKTVKTCKKDYLQNNVKTAKTVKRYIGKTWQNTEKGTCLQSYATSWEKLNSKDLLKYCRIVKIYLWNMKKRIKTVKICEAGICEIIWKLRKLTFAINCETLWKENVCSKIMIYIYIYI